jgi:histidine triad (HIT) family protein
MNNCIFCQIINKQAPARIVYEDEDVICFLPKKVEVYGHTLIVPKQHYADLYDIPENVLCDLVKMAKKLTLVYKEKINATGANLMHASGIDGQQSVFHFHFHLLPRFKDDELDTWPKLPKIEVDKDELLKKLRF